MPYNILPLDSAGASQPIMQFEEVLLVPRLIDVEILCFIWHFIEFFGFLSISDQGFCFGARKH